MPIIPVSDPDDPRIAGYRDIREKDLVGRQGHFVAEGLVVLKMLLSTSRHQPLSLLIAEKRLESVLPLLQFHPDLPLYAASDDILSRVAGFNMHRGILALGRRAPLLEPRQLLGNAPSPLVVLMGIANHDNMGGIFRNAAAFGASGIILDSDCCDPLYRKAIRVSVGTCLTLPFARLEADEDVLTMLVDAGYQPIALSPRGRIALAELKPFQRAAIFLGAEGPGLPNEILEKLMTVSIPMTPGVDSLNVATTSGIALHHFAARRP